MAIKFVSGDSIQMEFNLATSNVIHKNDLLMFTAGQVARATTSAGQRDTAIAGIYEGDEISTSDRAATDTIKLRVPLSRCVVLADCSGAITTGLPGTQYGIATSEISSGTEAMIGVANVNVIPFTYLRGGNSSGQNYFLMSAGNLFTGTVT